MVKKLDKSSVFALQNRIFKLRYGTESPTHEELPLFSYTCIAKYIKIDVKLVIKVSKSYFYYLQKNQ